MRNKFSTLSEQISINAKGHAKSHVKSHSKSTLAIALNSSKTIIKIAKVWTHIYQSQPFSGAEANVSKPIHFHNNQLTIECDSPSLLSHLRFNQTHLIKQLHKYGFNDINSINLTTKHKSNQAVFPEGLTEKKQTVERHFTEIASENSLKALEACAQTTQTSSLNNSLNNLLKSLKKLEAKTR